MTTVTIYSNKESKEPHHISVEKTLERIRDGVSKDLPKEERPVVIYAGRWKNGSKEADNIESHSGFMVLDWDKVDAKLKKSQLAKDTYIYAAWVSPSGNGVKALVKCPANIEKHTDYFNAILSRYPELDPSGRNINRLCYESYDPDLWVNPNSLVWDKTMTDEDYRKQKENRENKRKKKLKDISASMIRNAKDGEKHAVLLSASRLLGGAVATKTLTRDEAFTHLFDEICKRNIKDKSQAKKTINDGLDYGIKAPLHELKEIEKDVDFARREDGTYDFLADESEMDEYEHAVITGTLEFGLPTGLPRVDEYFMFKKHTLVWIAARDNVGKSFAAWYLIVLAAMQHDWKILVYSKENRDGAVRKKIKEFYIGKSIKEFNQTEMELAKEFIENHFKFFTAKKMHTVQDWLTKAEIVYDEGWEYDLLFGDPYNAFDVPFGANQYGVNLSSLNQLQTFKENYSAVWITDHINSSAARTKSDNGVLAVPSKHDVEYGQMKPNKCDDFLILHRNVKEQGLKYITEIHVDKVKDTETGGKPTPKDEPINLIARKDLCGFSCNGVDAVEEYWNRKNGNNSIAPNNEFTNHF